MEIFKLRLKEALTNKGISAARLSELSDISKPLISMYLSGKTLPRENNLKKLADALEVDIMWLGGTDMFCERKKKRFKKATLPILFEAE